MPKSQIKKESEAEKPPSPSEVPESNRVLHHLWSVICQWDITEDEFCENFNKDMPQKSLNELVTFARSCSWPQGRDALKQAQQARASGTQRRLGDKINSVIIASATEIIKGGHVNAEDNGSPSHDLSEGTIFVSNPRRNRRPTGQSNASLDERKYLVSPKDHRKRGSVESTQASKRTRAAEAVMTPSTSLQTAISRNDDASSLSGHRTASDTSLSSIHISDIDDNGASSVLFPLETNETDWVVPDDVSDIMEITEAMEYSSNKLSSQGGIANTSAGIEQSTEQSATRAPETKDTGAFVSPWLDFEAISSDDENDVHASRSRFLVSDENLKCLTNPVGLLNRLAIHSISIHAALAEWMDVHFSQRAVEWVEWTPRAVAWNGWKWKWMRGWGYLNRKGIALID